MFPYGMFVQMFCFLLQHYSITIPEQAGLKWINASFFDCLCYKNSLLMGKRIVLAAKTDSYSFKKLILIIYKVYN
jgi:hypothetical protein